MVLGIAMAWASRASASTSWTWDDGLRAAAIGGVIMPPLIGFIIGWAGTFDGATVVITFTFGAWLSLGLGFLAAGVRALRGRRAPTEAHVRRLWSP